MRRPERISRRVVCTAGRRAGFTLIELVASIGIVSVLMAAILSVMLIASKAIGSSDSKVANISLGNNALQQITTDLNLALSFSERTATAVTFTVPDRNGDGGSETIRYAWSGTAGDPLTYQYNGGTVVSLAQDVHAFDLDYLLKTVTAPVAEAEAQETAEMALISHDDASGGTMEDYQVKSNTWCGQYFMPTLPTNATTWKITRIKIRAEKDGDDDGQVSVQIRTADSNQKPTETVLDSTTLLELSLGSSYQWVEISFDSLSGLSTTQELCIVVKYLSGSSGVCNVEYEKNSTGMTANTHWLTTSNSGSTWTGYPTSRDMRFYVYGTVTTTGEPQWP